MTDSDTSTTDDIGSTDDIGYADAVAELDEILAELDNDGIDIDVLSELVERAAYLITVCRSRISAAQQRVINVVENLETTDPAP